MSNDHESIDTLAQLHDAARGYLNGWRNSTELEQALQTARDVVDRHSAADHEPEDKILQPHLRRLIDDALAYDNQLEWLRRENERLAAKLHEAQQLIADLRHTSATKTTMYLIAAAHAHSQDATVRDLCTRVQALEAEAQQYRGDHR